MSQQPSDALVFFGATGDLAYKQIFPALQALIQRGRLDMPVIGVAKSGWNLDQLKARAKDSLEKHGGLNAAAFAKLCSHLRYIDGDYASRETFTQLKSHLGNATSPLYYLAIPPSLFSTVAENLAAAQCVHNARVVVEKPFGRSLSSARNLNRILHEFFPEESIFRIDHYLGKEPVQNLTYFRFANRMVQATWDREHIDSVQITMAENFGVAGRGKFYEEAGAIRDVVQNHMLEVIANLGMECPSARDQRARRDERGKLLKAVRTLVPEDMLRGQFKGYKQEPGVAPDSTVETFAAMRFFIDNERWRDVPFYVRVGKRLPVTVTEVMIQLKPRGYAILDEIGPAGKNYYRFRLTPESVIALRARVKKPGEQLAGEGVELVAHRQSPDEMKPYERLLGDAARGDPTLFAREDAVEESWRIVDPVLDNATPLHEYQPNTWGPPVVDEKLKPSEGWHNPTLETRE
jgi:glucose-6-phosphate 1-dehydrogenase